MTLSSIIFIGAGSHANACIDVIEQHKRYELAGLVGRQEELHNESLGYRVIATDADLPELVKQYQAALITVGRIDSSALRVRLYERAESLGFLLPTLVSKSAYVSKHASVGAGTVVMHGAIVNAGARVGENCIINSRALVEHDATVGSHCHISTGAIVNGSAHVGQETFVGSGSVIRDGIAVGRNCVIGMGLSVRHQQADNTKFTGHGRT